MTLTPISNNLWADPSPFPSLAEASPFHPLFPREIGCFIFSHMTSYMSGMELQKYCTVSTIWKRFAERAFLHEIAFGKTQWNIYFGEIDNEPALPPYICEILKSPCPICPGNRVWQTHILTLIPATVNQRPLNLEYLGELVQKPLQGNATKYVTLQLGEYKDPTAPPAHWELNTNNVIEKSRKKTYSVQQALLASYSQTGADYEVPTILGITTSIFMKYIKSGTRLYVDHPLITYTRCQENYNDEIQLAISFNFGGGLKIHKSSKIGTEYYGMGGSRKLWRVLDNTPDLMPGEITCSDMKNTKPNISESEKKTFIPLRPVCNNLWADPSSFPSLEGASPFDPLFPREIGCLIFSHMPSYMSGIELQRYCTVSRIWKRFAERAFLHEIAFGKTQWNIHIGEIDNEPSLPSHICEILKSPCLIWPGKKVWQSHTLTLIPGTVNGIPLNLQYLGELVQKPLQGNPIKYANLRLGEYKDPATPPAHWDILTRDIIKKSRGKSYSDQQALLASISQKMVDTYEIPTILDVTTSIFMHYIKTGTRLYKNDYMYTYTHCQEKYDNKWQLAVGFFSDNLDVDCILHTKVEYWGVGGSRKPWKHFDAPEAVECISQ